MDLRQDRRGVPGAPDEAGPAPASTIRQQMLLQLMGESFEQMRATDSKQIQVAGGYLAALVLVVGTLAGRAGWPGVGDGGSTALEATLVFIGGAAIVLLRSLLYWKRLYIDEYNRLVRCGPWELKDEDWQDLLPQWARCNENSKVRLGFAPRIVRAHADQALSWLCVLATWLFTMLLVSRVPDLEFWPSVAIGTLVVATVLVLLEEWFKKPAY